MAVDNEAVAFSSLMAVVRMRGLMSVGVGIEIVGRREAPSIASVIEKAVIAQMIICVGDEDVEYHAPPQVFHVTLGRRPMLAHGVHNLKITMRFAVFRAQHAHGGKKRNTPLTIAIKAA